MMIATPSPTIKCSECGSEHFIQRELAPGIFADECVECGAEPVANEPFEFIHPLQGVNCELNYEHVI